MRAKLPTLFVLSSAIAVSAATVAQVPPGTKLTDRQAAILFGAREDVIDISLSPDGTKIGLVTPAVGQGTVLQVVDLATGSANPVNSVDGKPLAMSYCGWASSSSLVCRLYGVSAIDNELDGYSRLVGMNVDGSNVQPLGVVNYAQVYLSRSNGTIIDWRDGTTNQVLLSRNYIPAKIEDASKVGSLFGLGVDLVDTSTGKATRVEAPSEKAMLYVPDGQGNVRIKGSDATTVGARWNGDMAFHYRSAGDKEWKPFSTYSAVTEEGLYPIAVDGAANVAYALKKLDGRDALYRVALDGSMASTLAFADDKVDVSNVVRIGRRGRVVGARYTTDISRQAFFDPDYKALMERLHKVLPKLPQIGIIDSSADEKKHLVVASSDTDPGRYYLFDEQKKTLSQIASERGKLDGVPLATVRPISYKAADGTEIPGYLTLPPGSDGKGLPAIVMPHGGPASRDTWGFDWLAQFFANRGYAVIQPNFRGSSGYGQDWFQENGFKSWKIAIGDVNDAGRWLVSQGIADPAKLAIVGWSYGGYAALQANVLDPKLFKAAIAIAPVTDLDAFRDEISVYSKLGRDYIGQGPHIAEGSPARHAEKFVAPVLMFHGTNDINVRVNEARLMDRQLKKAGKSSELVIFKDIDHQLPDGNVRAEMLERSVTFLAKALNN